MQTEATTRLSRGAVQIAAIDAGISLRQINDAAGFGPGYIYQLLDTDRCQLSTLHRIMMVLCAHGVEVSAADLLEEVEVKAAEAARS